MHFRRLDTSSEYSLVTKRGSAMVDSVTDWADRSLALDLGMR